MGGRRKSRELALQLLYQLEVTREDVDEAIGLFSKGHCVPAAIMEYAVELVRGTRANGEGIDRLIEKYAENWALSRMAAVDRNVLRVAVYEMFISRGAPPIVVIDEAIDIAKKYSTPDSGAFVNGILDRIRKEEMGDAK